MFTDKSILLILFDLKDGSVRQRQLKLLKRDIQKYFRDTMPKKLLIFPQVPDIYTISNTLCISLPSWGNINYRKNLYRFEKELTKRFCCDVVLYDGKTTFVVKEAKAWG